MSDTEMVDVKELHDRLITVEGKVLALTYLLRRLIIAFEVLPAAAVEQQIKAMQDLETPTEFSKAIVAAAQDMLAVLIAKADAEIPTFSVIQGGKANKPD